MINQAEAQAIRDQINYVVSIMDAKGRGTFDHERSLSRQLWEKDWEDIRSVLVGLIAFMDTTLSIESRKRVGEQDRCRAALELVPPLLNQIRGFANDAFGGPSSLTDCIDLVLTESQEALGEGK